MKKYFSGTDVKNNRWYSMLMNTDNRIPDGEDYVHTDGNKVIYDNALADVYKEF